MQTFTGWEYILIDLANAFGLDKELFEERIKWATDNLANLEALLPSADNKPLFFKGVLAVRKAQRGEAAGHLVGMDACCSGIQIMSALTGCISGATATGLVDPTMRADAYSLLNTIMDQILGGNTHVSRADAKQALMTAFYGSKQEPINLFGADTPELNAFYQAANIMAPGAWELLQDLLASWQPYALEHSWTLPDGFQAKVKVMKKQEARVEVDELDHATFTYEFYENVGSKTGLSNVANVVHSVDAYVLRCIHRRCNYDHDVVYTAACLIQQEQGDRLNHSLPVYAPTSNGEKVQRYIKLFNQTGMVDVVILSYLDPYTTSLLSNAHLDKLEKLVATMRAHLPFPVVTIHDEFKCHANNMNHLRQHYINIFAELAESNLLSSILSDIHGSPGTFPKLSNNLGSLIRGSNYALS